MTTDLVDSLTADPADAVPPLPCTVEMRLVALLPRSPWLAGAIVASILLACWLGLRLALDLPVRLWDPAIGFVAAPLWFAFLSSVGVAFALVGFFGPVGADRFDGLAPLEPGLSPAGLHRRHAAAIAAAVPKSRLIGGLALAGVLAAVIPIYALMARRGVDGETLRFMVGQGFYFAAWMASFWLLFRGLALDAAGGRVLRALVADSRPDLLDLSPLEAFGRLGIYGALAWIATATGVVLVMVHPLVGPHPVAVVQLVIALLMAVVSFLGPMRQAHAAIGRVKRGELDHVRQAIRDRRADPGAGSSPLADLLAWEARLERVPDWPLDPAVAGRFASLLLVPALGWAASRGLEAVLARFLA